MSSVTPQRVVVLHIGRDRNVQQHLLESLPSQNRNIAVETAASKSDLFEVLDEGAVDCVLADHRRVGFDGVRLASSIASRGYDVPVVLYADSSISVDRDTVDNIAAVLRKDGRAPDLELAADRITEVVSSHRSAVSGRDRQSSGVDAKIANEGTQQQSDSVGTPSRSTPDVVEKLRDIHDSVQGLLDLQDVDVAVDQSLKSVERTLQADTLAFLAADPGGGETSLILTSLRGPTHDHETLLEGREWARDEFVFTAYEEQSPAYLPQCGGERLSECTDLDESFESAFAVPVGEYGILVALSVTPSSFSKEDRQLAEIQLNTLTKVLDSIKRERELREREEELSFQNRRLDEFASVVSHDFRGLLNAAQGRLVLATEQPDNPEHLRTVDHVLQRMGSMVDESVKLARQGDVVGETEKVVLPNIARKAWKGIETDGAELEVNARSYSFQADEDRLYHVFENIYRNAVDHAGDEPTVTVGLLADGSGFYIADDGPGIPDNHIDDIFDAGYTTSSGENNGLGLSIAHRIVEAHGWQIDVLNDDGARFEIYDLSFDNQYDVDSDFLKRNIGD